VRRYIDLTRPDILRLLTGTTPAYKSCAEAIRDGANFRIHPDTVAREGALRIYALRTQTARFEGVPTIGVDEALKDLAASAYARLRVAAVSYDYDFVMFLDPECREMIALFGIAGRTPRG
jgi:hypothetical protein